MAKQASEAEKRAIHSTLCPGEAWTKARKGKPSVRRKCDAMLPYGATYCGKCRTRFAEGALKGLRIPQPVKRQMARRDWAKKFGF